MIYVTVLSGQTADVCPYKRVWSVFGTATDASDFEINWYAVQFLKISRNDQYMNIITYDLSDNM